VLIVIQLKSSRETNHHDHCRCFEERNAHALSAIPLVSKCLVIMHIFSTPATASLSRLLTFYRPLIRSKHVRLAIPPDLVAASGPSCCLQTLPHNTAGLTYGNARQRQSVHDSHTYSSLQSQSDPEFFSKYGPYRTISLCDQQLLTGLDSTTSMSIGTLPNTEGRHNESALINT
jgi:hypothetical protein